MGGIIIIYNLHNKEHNFISKCDCVSDAIKNFKKENSYILNIIHKNIKLYDSNGSYIMTVTLK